MQYQRDTGVGQDVSFYPTQLSVPQPDMLHIEWNDGLSATVSVKRLRDHCPCASCRERRSAVPAQRPLLPILDPAETLPLRIEGMKPVGNYAYSIHFSDGHDTGIFTLEFLRELCQT